MAECRGISASTTYFTSLQKKELIRKITHKCTLFVVAVITPTGRVKNKAIPQASKTPHHGNWSCSLYYSHVNMVAAMLKKRMHKNHHSGTWLYFLISFVCTSIFLYLKADLLSCHISLHPPKKNKKMWVQLKRTWYRYQYAMQDISCRAKPASNCPILIVVMVWY